MLIRYQVKVMIKLQYLHREAQESYKYKKIRCNVQGSQPALKTVL